MERIKIEKNINDNLLGTIKNLKLQNNNLEFKIKELEDKYKNNIENESKSFNILNSPNNINILKQNDSYGQKENITKLNKKIKDLEEKLERYPSILEKNEKLISIIIYSEDESIHHSIICKNTDIFNKIENEISNIYPEK